MKIGIDGRALTRNRAGIGTYTYEMIKRINDMDNKNEYIIYSNKKVYIDFPLNNNLTIKEFNFKVGTIWLYFVLPKILYKDQIDTFWGTQHVLPKRNKYTKKIKFILTIHDVALLKIKGIGKWYNTIIQKLFVKKSCNNANKIMTISNSTKRDLIDLFGIDENKITTTYLGVNAKRNIKLTNKDEKSIIEKYDLKNKKFIFFLSTIEPRKNIITLIRAFNIFKENHNDFKLIISGGYGWRYKKILNEIKKSKFNQDIVLTGYISREEKEYFYKNCEFFAFPSLYEGFGIPVLEAFLNEALVVTSNNSSLPEVGGNAAFYYENVLNPIELASTFNEAISITSKEKEKRINDGLKIVNLFQWDNTAKETLKIITK